MQGTCLPDIRPFRRCRATVVTINGRKPCRWDAPERKSCANRRAEDAEMWAGSGPSLATISHMEPATAPRMLIVYFSRTGTTRKLAESIAHATGADLEELRESKSRLGIIGWIRSSYEGTYRLAADPLPLTHDPEDYDLVFVGSPTWNGALSSPVRGFLKRYGESLKSTALFATCTEKGAESVLDEMAALAAGPPLAKLAIREADVRHSPAVQVGELVEAALVAWEGRPSQLRRVADAQCCASG
jgi:flavodoxin